MGVKISDQLKYDPWDIKQNITDIRVSILSCRYSMLSEWECENLIAPFWRIYHSRLGGGFIWYNGKMIKLVPNTIVIIPPYTSFSSHIKSNSKLKNDSIKSIRINEVSEIELYQNKGMIDQMFIHFKLGFPYNQIEPNIHSFEVNEHWENIIRTIEQHMIDNPDYIDFQHNLSMNYLVLYALQLLPAQLWNIPIIDERIMTIINYINSHISEPLSNDELSKIVNLAKNSFARLFKENIKCTVQQFIQQRRIDLAINLFHHSNIQIEEIALQCGFCDRHHFSHTFKKFTGVSPGSYWKKIN